MVKIERGSKKDRNRRFNSMSGNKVLSYQLLIVSIDPGVNSNHIISIEGDRINSTFLTGCISSISKSLMGVPLTSRASRLPNIPHLSNILFHSSQNANILRL